MAIKVFDLMNLIALLVINYNFIYHFFLEKYHVLYTCTILPKRLKKRNICFSFQYGLYILLYLFHSIFKKQYQRHLAYDQKLRYKIVITWLYLISLSCIYTYT